MSPSLIHTFFTFPPSHLPIFLPFLPPIFIPSLLLPSYLPSFYLPTFPPSTFLPSLLLTSHLLSFPPSLWNDLYLRLSVGLYKTPSYLPTSYLPTFPPIPLPIFLPSYLPTYNLPIPLPPYHPTFLLTFSPSYLPCRMTSTWGWGLASTKHCNSTSRLQFVTAVLWSKLTRGMSKQIIYKLTDRLTDCWLIDWLLINWFVG